MELEEGMDGLPGLALLAMPWLVLAVMAWRAGYRLEARHASLYAVLGRPPNTELKPHDELDTASASGMALRATSLPDDVQTLKGPLAEEATVPSSDEIAPVVSVPDAHESEEAILKKTLAAAEEGGDAAGLTESALALARLKLGNGHRAQAEALLRKTIVTAMRHKLPEAHAQARMALAELAIRDGDMTTACEHWQMAKLLYHELDRRADQDLMAEIMRKNGCPTDWVLTEF